jgi:hypothetical protein
VQSLRPLLAQRDRPTVTRMPNFAGLLAAAHAAEYLGVMDPEDAAAIESVTIDERTDDKGPKHRRVKLELQDKRAAPTDLGRHLGMGTGRVQVEQAPPMARALIFPRSTPRTATPCARYTRKSKHGNARRRSKATKRGDGRADWCPVSLQMSTNGVWLARDRLAHWGPLPYRSTGNADFT